MADHIYTDAMRRHFGIPSAPQTQELDAIGRLCDEVDRLRAENAALAAALEDIAGITYSPAHNAYVAGECSRFDGHECYIADPDDPGEWGPVCVAEVAWCAWRMGVLR